MITFQNGEFTVVLPINDDNVDDDEEASEPKRNYNF